MGTPHPPPAVAARCAGGPSPSVLQGEVDAIGLRLHLRFQPRSIRHLVLLGDQGFRGRIGLRNVVLPVRTAMLLGVLLGLAQVNVACADRDEVVAGERPVVVPLGRKGVVAVLDRARGAPRRGLGAVAARVERDRAVRDRADPCRSPCRKPCSASRGRRHRTRRGRGGRVTRQGRSPPARRTPPASVRVVPWLDRSSGGYGQRPRRRRPSVG
jgi:hypothetical protein